MSRDSGAINVNWLREFGADGLRSLLSLPLSGKVSDASSPVLFLLNSPGLQTSKCFWSARSGPIRFLYN